MLNSGINSVAEHVAQKLVKSNPEKPVGCLLLSLV